MKKEVTKKKTKKATQKQKVEFNIYSLYLQTISILMVLVSVVLNLTGVISTELLLDLFCIGVIILASSLFPKRK